MKKLICFLVLAMAMPVMADEIYTSTIDGKECKIEFVAGPFSPWESGYAKLYFNDVLVGQYNYFKTDSNGLQVYDVLNLCKFIGYDQKLEAVVPIATFVRHLDTNQKYLGRYRISIVRGLSLHPVQ